MDERRACLPEPPAPISNHSNTAVRSQDGGVFVGALHSRFRNRPINDISDAS